MLAPAGIHVFDGAVQRRGWPQEPAPAPTFAGSTSPAADDPQAKMVADAEAGDANAQFNLGAIYANGRGVPANPKEAVRLYRLAVAKGHLGAMNNLAFMLKTGSGTDKNEREALSLYEKIMASERDDPGAKAMKNIAAKNIESIKGCLALPNGCESLPATERGTRRQTD